MNGEREKQYKGRSRALARDQQSERGLRPDVPSKGSGPTTNGIKRAISIIGGLVIIFLIWFLIVRPAVADGYLKKMLAVNLEDRFAYYEILDWNQKIISYAKYTSAEIPYRYRYVNLLLKLASLSKDKERQERIYQEAEKELKIIDQKNPLDFDYYPTLAKLMVQWRKSNSNKNEEVNQVFQKATAYNPDSGFLYYLWGVTLKEMGEYSQAKEKLTNALILFSYPDLSNLSSEILKNLKLIQAEISYQLSETEKLIGN